MPKICFGLNGFIFGQPWHDTIEKKTILDFARRNEFDGAELHEMYDRYDLNKADDVRKEYQSYGLEIPAIQVGSATRNSPASNNPEIRKKYVETVKSMMEFGKAVGAKVATGGLGRFVFGLKFDDMVRNGIETFNEVAGIAEDLDMIYSLEPEPDQITNGGYFRTSLDVIQEILDKVKSKNFQITYDYTQVNVLSGDPVGYLKALKGRVAWVHIADNDGFRTPFVGTAKHMAFGDGCLDIDEITKTLKETCPHLEWLQIDVWESPTPFETAEKNKPILIDCLRRIGWK